ncbi:uncharacterized protein LOC132728593 [Ruditapes philippinarum]|uniref:uncharacterized protein LOC132728593 n=1 Tax=Ruditapes philippinarum TaxID=129788 RepID=UPI00295B4EDB|nr:uncharacterized protein LOC132728593 [Ruditapes philippinarum]
MNREYDSTCSKTQDSKCGSCLTNYEDIYGHFLFPCSPKKEHKELIPPKGEKPIRPDGETETAGDTPKDSKVTKSPSFWIPVGITGIVVSFIVVVIFVGRKLKLATHKSDSSAEGAHDYTEINILHEGTIPKDDTALLDGDIDIDAVREDTVPNVSTHIPRRNENVRTELENGQQPCARPELTQHIPSLSQLDGISVLQLSDGRIVSLQIVKDFCECKEQRSCECSSFYFPNLQLEKSDEYILITASEICHEYSELFQKLGLTPPVLYQESDTRDRDPEKITQKELFTRLLNIWIEMKFEEATLKNLSIALCEAKFHKINKLLIDLYRNKIQSIRNTPSH